MVFTRSPVLEFWNFIFLISPDRVKKLEDKLIDGVAKMVADAESIFITFLRVYILRILCITFKELSFFSKFEQAKATSRTATVNIFSYFLYNVQVLCV